MAFRHLNRAALIHPGCPVNFLYPVNGSINHRQHKEHLTSRFQFAIYQERRYHHHQAGEQRHIPLQEKPDGKQDCQYRSNAQNNLLQHVVGDAFALQFEVLIFCFFDGIV